MIENVMSENGIWENTSIGDVFLEEGEGRSFQAGEEILEENRTVVDERTTPWQMFRRVIEQVISSTAELQFFLSEPGQFL